MIDYGLYEKILSGSIIKLNMLGEDQEIKDATFLALNKTLNKIKEGKLSPAIFPILINKDLSLNKENLSIELSIICAYFHTAADLADDVEDESKDNPVINKYGFAQAINISNKLIFLYQELILELNIEPKNKLELLSLFSKSGSTMTLGQFYDLALTNRNSYIYNEDFDLKIKNIINISKSKTGTEIGCFFSCLFVALGKNKSPYYELGVVYGSLIQVFSDYFDIWCSSISDDLICLKNSLPIFASINDSSFKNEVKLFLAGKNDTPKTQFVLKRILSKTRAVEELKNFFEDSSFALSHICSILKPLKQINTLIDSLLSECKVVIKSLDEIRDVVLVKTFYEHFDLEKTIQSSIDFINQDSSLKDTWEVQRTCFLDEPILFGNIFTPSLVIETLIELNMDVSEHIKNLISLKGDIGWYYYSNTNKLPTDSDVLGQLLNITSKSKFKDKSIFSKPLEILEKNIEVSGKCPTWLVDDINHKKSDIEKWYGNECLGVMSNAYYGLFLFDYKKYQNIIDNGVNYIINSLDSEKLELNKSSYYNYYYTFYLVSRLVNSLKIKSPKLNKIKEKILREQNLNGSWNNSNQDTASILMGLSYFDNVKDIVFRTGAKFLSDSQNYDGSWDSENLFVCPGKRDRLVFYKNTKVTTSICLRALLIVNKMLKESSLNEQSLITSDYKNTNDLKLTSNLETNVNSFLENNSITHLD